MISDHKMLIVRQFNAKLMFGYLDAECTLKIAYFTLGKIKSLY